jgi:hypothetical protein
VKIYRILAVLLLTFSCIISSPAQPAPVQQLQNIQLSQQLQAPPPGLRAGTNAPELYQGENEDVGPQRILRLRPHTDYFDILFDSQVFYTDNANFAPGTNAIGSTIFVNTVQAAFMPPPMTIGPGKFAPTVGVASQWYNYADNRMAPLDFEAQTVFLNGKYTIGKWQIGAGMNYTRLVNQAYYEQTYQELLPTFGIQRIIPIGDRLLLAIGDQVDYHLTHVPLVSGSRTDINDHFDNIVNVTFSWQMTQHFIVQPYYRFQFSNYRFNTFQTSDRNDYLHTYGIVLFYYFNKDVSLRAFLNYSSKHSDDSVISDYHEYDGGLGVSLEFKF